MNGRATSLGLLLCTLLACGEGRNLSVGEVRCERVSCVPIGVVWFEEEVVEVEQVDREEMLVPVISDEPFCGSASLSRLAGRDPAADVESLPICMGGTLVAVGEEQLIVATRYVTDLDAARIETGLHLSRYAGDELQWENVELERELPFAPSFVGDTFAVASSGVQGEAFVGVTREPGANSPSGANSAYGQTFYTLKDDGELIELFEDENAGRIRSIAALGDDLIVASEYELRTEVTRYTQQGEIVWRQTTLTAGDGWVGAAPADPSNIEVRVIDDERIVVLVPREYAFQVMELTDAGELVRSWATQAVGPLEQPYYGARLVVGPRGQFVVGFDGYEINRGTLDGGEPHIELFAKLRSQYYSPTVLGLHVDHAGYIYIATVDGVRERPYGLIERVSPDLSKRDSFVIDGHDFAPDGLSLVIGGELFVTEDQQTLYFGANGAIGRFELPPIED